MRELAGLCWGEHHPFDNSIVLTCVIRADGYDDLICTTEARIVPGGDTLAPATSVLPDEGVPHLPFALLVGARSR
jgi:hypothetical protein